MIKLHELQEKRAGLVKAMRDAVTLADTEKRSLDNEEVKAFAKNKAEVEALDAQISRVEYLNNELRTAKPTDTLNSLESRISVTDAIAAQMEGRALTGALAEYNQEHEQRTGQKAKGVVVPSSIFEKRVQTTTTASKITPVDFRADEYIGLLRESLVVKELGARVLPNLRGDVVIPRMDTGATAYWVDENEALTASQQGFGEITLSPKHVGALTELSRQLIQQSNPAIEQLVRDDFVQVISHAVDKAVLSGNGVKEPQGILGLTGIQTDATLTAYDWANMQELISLLELANINPNAFLINPATAKTLRTTLKEAGLPGYVMEAGVMADLPVRTSTAIGAANVLLGDFSQILIGEWGGVDILVNPYAAGVYEKGNVQVRILTTVGTAVRHPKAFALGTVGG